MRKLPLPFVAPFGGRNGFDGGDLSRRLRVEDSLPRKSSGKIRNANDNAYALAA